MAKETTDAKFSEDVLNSKKPVLVDFWAEWCGPCRQLAPIIDEISNDYSDKLEVYKVNIDKNPDAPAKYGVRGIPTMIIFENGKPVSTKVGAVPKSSLTSWIEGEIS
jgi:thioredoxin 1